MNNREKINSMTNEEIAATLCNFINDIADRVEKDDMCSFCPVNKLCRRGHNGFVAWLSQEATDNA